MEGLKTSYPCPQNQNENFNWKEKLNYGSSN